jgi:outer membrane protein TolC
VILLLLCAFGFAADISFEDALRQAVGNTPAARLVAADAASAKADARASAAWANPDVGVHVEPDQTAVDIRVPVDFGALGRGGVVPAAVEAAELRRRAALAAVGAAAGAAWLDARRAVDVATLTLQAETLSGRLAAAARARMAAGEVSGDEGALLLADAASTLDRALTWEQEARNATARLSVLLGVPVDGMGVWPTIPAPPALDAGRLVTVLAADLDARIALGNLHAERLARIPALELQGGYILRGAVGPTYGASIAIPLFAPGVARVRAAAARADSAEAVQDQTRAESAATLAAAQAEMTLAERLAGAWDIPGLDGALDAATRRYDAGELSLSDYLARRNLAVEALQNAIDARWRLARARLAAWELAGALPIEVGP